MTARVPAGRSRRRTVRNFKRWSLAPRLLIGASVVAALAVSGCGGGKEPEVASVQPGGPTASATAVAGDLTSYVNGMRAWVACLRAEGVDVSDPGPTGEITFPGDAAALKSDAKFQAAQAKCHSQVPPVPESVLEMRKPKLSPEQIDTARRYARCMQQNGAPDFPDPGPDGNTSRNSKWNQTSEGARKATTACAGIIGDPTNQPSTRG
ncbi:hypothetical protein [Planosporangium mesophilum]|uniref:hypothetical protein n=1 Tax=Planosporangium mesophilum TaxID=689768 RepID=UPI0019519EA3|nr:hypothetical protein [Planosporangium mesophilum]